MAIKQMPDTWRTQRKFLDINFLIIQLILVAIFRTKIQSTGEAGACCKLSTAKSGGGGGEGVLP